jgi:VanZ family protein
MSRKTKRSGGPSAWWVVGVVLAVAAVFWLTLRPDEAPGFPTGTNWKPLDHHGKALQALKRESANREAILYYLVSDVLGNVLLFTPLGAVLAGALAGRRDRSGAPERSAAVRLFGATGLGVLLSTAIEVVQLRIPGRATDVDDVIFNTLGALVGASALLVGERVRARRAARG